VRCHRCTNVAPTGSRYCPACGSALVDTPVAPGPDDATVAALPLAATRTHLDPRSNATPIAAIDYAPGTLLAGRYRVVTLLGRGGMGVVYLADDLRLGHPVALKFLPAILASDPRRLQQFHDEVRHSRQISHSNVCDVYDIGDVDGHLFLSMEYVEGRDLAAVLRDAAAEGSGAARLPEAEAVDLARQICAGLAAVHASGVLHRDLKPANIMITNEGVARLLDFGIAMSGEEQAADRITEGTPAYMAPEQLVERQVSVRSDIYALGLVMYELFTGRRLFEAKTLEELTADQAALPSRVPPDLAVVSPRLREVVLQCLDRDPARRPESAAAVAGRLQVELLDAETRDRRMLQVITQASFLPLVILGSVLVSLGGIAATAGVVFLAACLVLVANELRNPLGWEVTYKGHRIAFRNHALFGERLYIDDVLTDRGRFGFEVTLRGTIEQGRGAGERITAHVRATFTRLACRIVAEAFAPSRG
jgi:predicted Ser/Thr protein kinase